MVDQKKIYSALHISIFHPICVVGTTIILSKYDILNLVKFKNNIFKLFLEMKISYSNLNFMNTDRQCQLTN